MSKIKKEIKEIKKTPTPNQLTMVRVEVTKFKNGTSYKLIYE